MNRSSQLEVLIRYNQAFVPFWILDSGCVFEMVARKTVVKVKFHEVEEFECPRCMIPICTIALMDAISPWVHVALSAENE